MWRQFIVLPLLFSLACGGEGRGEGRGKGSWEGRRVEPVTVVEVAEVGRGAVSDRLLANATVESEADAQLFPSATGTVVSIHKEVGEAVRRGDLLAVLDNVQLDASNDRASAELVRLEEQVGRLEQLYAKGAVSQRELDDARHSLTSARTSATEARRSFGQTRITSPFAGVVAARDVKIGELASSGSRAFWIVDLDRLRVLASLPERDISRVADGQRARLVSAYDDDVWANGAVQRVAPVIDATSGTFQVTIGLDPDQSALRPGQFVSVELEVDRHEDVVVVPRRAVVYEDGRPVVYRMIPEPEPEEAEDEEGGEDEKEETSSFSVWSLLGSGSEETDDEADEEEEGGEEEARFVAERVNIERGLADDFFVEVISGVAVGDEIVTLGQSNLRDGARIRAAVDESEADNGDGVGEADGG